MSYFAYDNMLEVKPEDLNQLLLSFSSGVRTHRYRLVKYDAWTKLKMLSHDSFPIVFDFDDKKVTFKTTNATINNKFTEIYGDCVVLGKLNVYVKSKGQDIKKLIKTIQTSPILVDVQKVVASSAQVKALKASQEAKNKELSETSPLRDEIEYE